MNKYNFFFIIAFCFFVYKAEANPIKIHCIGNSITQAAQPGFRGYLFQKLFANNFDVDFVGVKQEQPENGGDPDNSGFGGYLVGPGKSSADIWDPNGKANIYENLDSGFNLMSVESDIIILEIGINDFLRNLDSNYNPNIDGAVRLDSLIKKIFEYKPNVILFVSSITPAAYDTHIGDLWNSQLPNIVNKYVLQGKKCYLADLRNNISWDINNDISADQLHPSASGYSKIADCYYNTLNPILKKLSIHDSNFSKEQEIEIFPNPSRNFISFKNILNRVSKIKILDITGKKSRRICQ